MRWSWNRTGEIEFSTERKMTLKKGDDLKIVPDFVLLPLISEGMNPPASQSKKQPAD